MKRPEKPRKRISKEFRIDCSISDSLGDLVALVPDDIDLSDVTIEPRNRYEHDSEAQLVYTVTTDNENYEEECRTYAARLDEYVKEFEKSEIERAKQSANYLRISLGNWSPD